MGIAQDLLRQANHLATYEGASPTQASLRRAVSTAYYALFHLLLEDASRRWLGTPEARHGLERAFDHGQMKKASLQFLTEVEEILNTAQTAFQDWQSIQMDQMAGNYLLSMLLKKQR